MVIVEVITTLLFLLPILYRAISLNLFKEFGFQNLVRTFNKAIIPQLILVPILGVVAYAMDRIYYVEGDGNELAAIVILSWMTYFVVGGFYYIPGLVILNLINWIRKKMGGNDSV